ncbi:DUF3533 domain-containing protein [Mycena indigotica]|uniref:DUF3533 domain-containing protein n=1 Tax=Mycena indigotica TaxID=2126181 RepID=A0A8H6WA30_9AGAR|nr:DUF3533 domain-containing protein [Mycena indigotica]KAF7310322.1 DUF3533 domain-containing protein [Mycena indigotica]
MFHKYIARTSCRRPSSLLPIPPMSLAKKSSHEAVQAGEHDSVSHATTAVVDDEPAPRPFSGRFRDKTPAAAEARKVYIRTVFGGMFAICLVIFVVFSIYWGSVWRTPRHPLLGWVVDFDGGAVGQAVSNALGAIPSGRGGVRWTVVPASRFPGGIAQLQDEIVDEKAWYAVTINRGATTNLSAAVAAVDAAYNSSSAITFFGSEARNENIYRIHYRVVTAQLDAITFQFNLGFLRNMSSANNLPQLLSTAPALVSRPVYFTSVNLRPFDVPVASAVTFVGLIYLLILAFFIVNVSAAARQVSTLENTLTLRSLVTVRLMTSVFAYFFVALFYTLLSRAFQLPFDRHYGRAGFVIFWMLNFIGMLACGLALEAALTLLTIHFVPFFLIFWIICNVSTCVFPIATLPHIYRYGYVFPFYNIARAVRSIVFGTKNQLGVNFAVLFVWTLISFISIPIFQWWARRGAARAAANAQRGEKL